MCKVVLPELLFDFADEPQATSVKAASTDTVPSATFDNFSLEYAPLGFPQFFNFINVCAFFKRLNLLC